MIVHDAMHRLDVEDMRGRFLNQLSGGEKQKVMLARALAQQPSVLLLDEPTSSLDPKNQHEMLALVNRISKEQGIGVVIVIHDLNLAARYCDRFLFLHDSKIFAAGGQEILSAEHIRQVYGMDVDVIEHRGNKLIIAL